MLSLGRQILAAVEDQSFHEISEHNISQPLHTGVIMVSRCPNKLRPRSGACQSSVLHWVTLPWWR